MYSAPDRKLLGISVQAGMFFSEVWDAVPEPLEFAVRFAHINRQMAPETDTNVRFRLQWEWSF
jgi:hypothetical protein